MCNLIRTTKGKQFLIKFILQTLKSNSVLKLPYFMNSATNSQNILTQNETFHVSKDANQVPELKLGLQTSLNSQHSPILKISTTTINDYQSAEVWAELKVQDKNILKRCYHVSFIYNSWYPLLSY